MAVQRVNLRNIWLMVVLVVDQPGAGTLMSKALGSGRTVVRDCLGVWSRATATTVTFSKRRGRAGRMSAGALVIMLASSVVYVRLLLEDLGDRAGLFEERGGPLG